MTALLASILVWVLIAITIAGLMLLGAVAMGRYLGRRP